MGQRQHSQAEKVDRQQEVDVLLGKHLRGGQRKVTELCVKDCCRRASGKKRKKNLEKEVEAEQSAAGDDGEAGSVATRDGLGHVRPVLERGDRDGGAGWRQSLRESLHCRNTLEPTMTGVATTKYNFHFQVWRIK